MHTQRSNPFSMNLMLAVVGVLAAFGVATAQESTWIVTDGNWSAATNWNPQSVPDSPGESALVPAGSGAYTITLDLNPTVEGIRMLNPTATLLLGSRTVRVQGTEGLVNHGILRANGTPWLYGRVQNAASGDLVVHSGSVLYLVGPTVDNDGTVLLNDVGAGDASIDIRGDLTLRGSGEIRLNGDNQNDYIYAYYSHVLTQDAGHSIRGFGGVTAPLVNRGTLDADVAGGFLRLSGSAKSNEGLLRASNGGRLEFSNLTLTNTGGTILADGGDVQIDYGNVIGGTIDRTGNSVARIRHASVTDLTVAPTGWVDVPTGYASYLYGSTLTNGGTIRVNDVGTGDASIDVRAELSLRGGGDVLLNGDNQNDVILAYYNHVLTQEADHRIHGFGGITLRLVNHGTVDADRNGGYLRLSGYEKWNDGLLRASGGGLLDIVGCTIHNAGGTIFADGGDVQVGTNAVIEGGTYRRTGASRVKVLNGWVTDGTLAPGGWIDVPSSYVMYLNGSAMTNDGTIRLNDIGTGDASIDLRANLSLRGGGDLLLNGDNNNDVIYAYFNHILTQEADHTIHGFGGITLRLVNHGTVDADRNGGYLRLSGYEKWNDGLLRASGGGLLDITGCTIHNAGGTIFADGGDVQLGTNAIVEGGTYRRTGASKVKVMYGWVTDGTLAPGGWIDVPSSYVMYLNGSAMTNDGTIRLNDTGTGDAGIDVRSNLLLRGSGDLLLNGDSNNDVIFAYYNHILTQEAGHTIHGKGAMTLRCVNRGTVRADSARTPLYISSGSFSNEGLCEASGGAQLQLQNTPVNYAARRLSGGTWAVRTGSSIVLNNAPVDTVNATVVLDGPGSFIYRDYSGNSALSSFAGIGPKGTFTIRAGRDFATAGNLRVQGTLDVQEGCTFTVPGTCTTGYPGRILVEGTLTSPNPVTLEYGRLCGGGTVLGNVRNVTGAIEPGSSVDTLRIDGNLEQTANGKVVIELGGTTPDRVDLLQVTGEAILGGTLELVTIDGHHVRPGDSYKVMTYGSRQGEFATIFGRCLEPGVCFDVVYHPSDVTLIARQIAPSDVIEEETVLPGLLALRAGNAAGDIFLDLPWDANVTLAVYDVAGRLAAELVDGDLRAGTHTVRWNDRARSGIYFARAIVRSGERNEARTVRFLVVR